MRDAAVQTNKNQLDPLNNYEAQVNTKRLKDLDKVLGTARKAVPSFKVASDAMLGQISDIMKHPGKEFALSRGGVLVPENELFKGDTNDFRIKQKSLNAKAMAAGLEEMRKSGSPGTITEKEWPIMQGIITEMQTAQTQEAFNASAAKLVERIQDNKKAVEESIVAMEAERADLRSSLNPQDAASEPAKEEGGDWYILDGKKVYY